MSFQVGVQSPPEEGIFYALASAAHSATEAVTDWSKEHAYREGWGDDALASQQQRDREFCFREAGVVRFNDVVDDGYEESGHEP